mmetsp:Transcript_10454/g.15279  ORF Transcript_10454/g.15279 Transcript_10454/m.15279 type:complete len:482 (+) Transcript_10454:79-1524(+)
MNQPNNNQGMGQHPNNGYNNNNQQQENGHYNNGQQQQHMQHHNQQGPPQQHQQYNQQGPPMMPPNQYQGQGPPPHHHQQQQQQQQMMYEQQGPPPMMPRLRQPVLVQYNVQGTTFEIPEKYEIQNVVGQGAYGIVCSGMDRAENEPVAIKKILNIFDHELEFQKRIYREIKILKHFDHENIICLWDLLPPKDYNSFKEVYIVTDLMQTDLRQIIKSNQPLTEQHIQYFLYQILRALKHIHSADVLHRDLKPGNILVNSDCELKICDFGLSRAVDFENDAMMSTPYVATRWYRSPELLTMWTQASKAIDVWSVGCIFAELLNRRPLFKGKNYLNQLDLIIDTLGKPTDEDIVGCQSAREYIGRKPDKERTPLQFIFPNATELALDLLDKMLTFNPNRRYTVEQCLAHPYLQKLHEPNDEPNSEPFDYSFEKQLKDKTLTKERMKQLIYDEIMHWNYHENHIAGDAIIRNNGPPPPPQHHQQQ